ncbi:carbohydrate-binding protein [Hamadaea tsunoensis]|uniref:carbohydrate-binding protein n=1 Tax=Hamadaea tsunoensis TaxID=53368 RepID=UPI00040F6B60|nr:carbohydrate-binding protein [Hamadaea tsunoensis]
MARSLIYVALVAVLGVTAAAPASAHPSTTAPSTADGLARPAADDPAARGATAPIGGVVPGLTGAAAQQAAGAAAAQFKASRLAKASLAAAQLHTTWGVDLPNSASAGLHATQSVLTGITTTGGDYVYAPTAIPASGACIEMTTAYTPSGSKLWAWDWCGGRDGVGKIVNLDASFLATYTTTVNGRAAYSLDEHRTSTTANTWTAYLYNYQTHVWDAFFTSSGTYDLPQFPFGWNMFEIYTSVNPATGAGYYCKDVAGKVFESSSVQVLAGATWVAAAPGNSQVDPAGTPSGSAYDCPSLSFTLAHANDHWTAQLSGGSTATGYEAEASANTRGGQAAVRSSAGASGGAVVGYVGNGTANYLQINNVTGTAGAHTLTIYYASGENRSATVSVNGGTATTVSTPASGGWDTIGSVTTTVTLTAGSNTIRFGNPSGWAPDFDRITLS